MTDTEAFIRAKYKVDSEKVKIAFFGQPGAGKSSLINALCGEVVAKTGNTTDTTLEAQIIDRGEVVFIDLPGYGTSKFPPDYYFQKFDPLQYDLFVCVFDDKLHEADTAFFQGVFAAQKPCVFVRNKADLIYEADKTQEECYTAIREDLRRQTGKSDLELVFVSARKDVRQGIAELNTAIEAKMDAARVEKYRLAVKSYTASELELKRKACVAYIGRSAKLAAANGLNPILGLDVAVDLAILKGMYKLIAHSFGITEDKVRNSLVSTEVKNYATKGLTKEGVAMIMRAAGKKFAQKTAFKLVPLAGQAFAAYVGYHMIQKSGLEYMEACYQIAQEELYRELNITK